MPGGRPRRNSLGGRPTRSRSLVNSSLQRDANREARLANAPERVSAYLNLMDPINIRKCTDCDMFEVSRDTRDSGICASCRRGTNLKFRTVKNMDVGDVPNELKNLTMVEELIISLIHPQIKVYRVPGSGQLRYTGNMISFPQDVSSFATSLPHNISDLPIILVTKETIREGQAHKRDFRIRSAKVLTALRWLKQNNILNRDVVINQESLNLLPVDADITQLLRRLNDLTLAEPTAPIGEPAGSANDSNENYDDERDLDTFSPASTNFSLRDETRAALAVQYPAMSSTPVDNSFHSCSVSNAIPVRTSMFER